MNCGNCGSNVNPGDMFCQNCGAGINNSSSNQNPVISDEVLVDAYIGKNIEEIRKGNFSWCTFFFDVFYAFYRKMWLFGILYLLSYLVWAFLIVILIVLLVKQINEITFIQNYVKYYSIIYGGITLTSLALRLIFSFKFKKVYLKHATKKVEQIKVRNMGKTNEEIKKECSKKGGTSIFGIFLAILLPIILYLLLAILNAIQTKNTLDKVQNSVVKDSAYVIIEEVEMAYFSASIDKELITLEDVRNEYRGKFSTWSGNVIKSTHYDFTCDVIVNNDNKMLVSCDVFGEKIESELLDLNIGKKENNQANDNQNNGTDKESVNNKEEVNNAQNNNLKVSLFPIKIYSNIISFYERKDGYYHVDNYKNEKELGRYECTNDSCGYCNSYTVCSNLSGEAMNTNGLIYLYDYNKGETANTAGSFTPAKIILWDVYNNKAVFTQTNIISALSLSASHVSDTSNIKYVILENKNKEKAILDVQGNYIKNYSNKNYVISGYEGQYISGNSYMVESNLIVTIKNGKHGIENIKGNKTVIDHKYDEIVLYDNYVVNTNDSMSDNIPELYKDKYFKARTGNKWSLYNIKTGNKVINKEFDRIYLLNENTIVVYNDGYLSFIDYNGNSISGDKIKVSGIVPIMPKSPEGIRFIVSDFTVQISINEGSSYDDIKISKYVYNIETKKVIKIN